MIKNLFMYIFIYTLLVGCNTQVIGYEEPDDYTLEVTAPSLEQDENGYYHIQWDGYNQTFSTLNAETGSEDYYQAVYWESNSGIHESFTGDWVSAVNCCSYTNNGLAHTVLSVWEENIGDTLVVQASYTDEYGREYIDHIQVIVHGVNGR